MTDLVAAVLTLLAFGLVVAGIAMWTVPGALVAGGLLLAAWARMYELSVERDDRPDL